MARPTAYGQVRLTDRETTVLVAVESHWCVHDSAPSLAKLERFLNVDCAAVVRSLRDRGLLVRGAPSLRPGLRLSVAGYCALFPEVTEGADHAA